MFFFLRNAMRYRLVVGVSVAIRMTRQWYRAENIRKDLERSRSEAELQNLKSQLNPHFLFNTLNNIYSLIQFDPDRAQQTVHDLSRLLRYVLYDSSRPTVPLKAEMDFLGNYIELMRIRLPRMCGSMFRCPKIRRIPSWRRCSSSRWSKTLSSTA